MQITTYTDNLQNQVIAFIQKTWLELGRNWDPEGREKDLLRIPEEYQVAGGDFWVVLNDEQMVIGTIALKALNAFEGEIGRLYLDPIYRGKGIGYNLLQVVIEQAKKSDFKKIKLDTSKKLTQAYHLFKSVGFVETKQDFDDEGSVFMEMDLIKE